MSDQDELDSHAENAAARSAELSASTSSISLVGVRLGDYQVLRKLGRGGMADVYAARHVSLGRDVAIKVLRSDFANDKDYISRFRREARSAAKLNHPNIVQVYDVGDVNGHHFIAQELIDGENLREHLSSQGSLDAIEGVDVLLAVASALEAAADVGITHRDIKPENIMRSSRGAIKVADFGLARMGVDADASRANLTQAGLTMGTPRYMSPEQVQGRNVDVRSDLYSLGVSMYHLLSGRPPFEAEDPIALAVMHLHETPTPLDRARGSDDLPEWLIAIVARLMNKLPEDRFQTPSALIEALRSETSISSVSGQHAIGTAAATIRLQRVTDSVLHRKRRLVARGAIAAIFVAASAAGGYWAAHQIPVQSVSRMLRPELVPPADSVEQQFFNAINRDDVVGWESIGLHFPPNQNSKNFEFYNKSLFQLASLHARQGRLKESNAVLDQILAIPKTEPKYRAVAWARKCVVLAQLKDEKALGDAKRKLTASYEELKANNPAAIQFFERAVPELERIQFQLTDPGDDNT